MSLLKQPSENEGLEEAINIAKKSQRRIWIVACVWLIAIFVVAGMFLTVVRKFEASQSELKGLRADLQREQMSLLQQLTLTSNRLEVLQVEEKTIRATILSNLNKTVQEIETNRALTDELTKTLKIAQSDVESGKSNLQNFENGIRGFIRQAERQFESITNEAAFSQQKVDGLSTNLATLQQDILAKMEQLSKQVGGIRTTLGPLVDYKSQDILPSQYPDVGVESGSSKSIQARLSKAMALIIKNEYTGAISELNQVINLTDDSADLGYAHMLRGIAKNRISLDKSALADLTTAISFLPTNALAHSILGEINHDLGEYETSLRAYNNALKLQLTAATLSRRGHLYLKHIKDYDKALADFNGALKLDPKNRVAYEERGLTRLLKKDYGGAGKDFKQAYDYAISEEGRASALEKTALLYLCNKQYSKAYDAAVQVEALMPQRAWNAFILSASANKTQNAVAKIMTTVPLIGSVEGVKARGNRGDEAKVFYNAWKAKADEMSSQYLFSFLSPEMITYANGH